MFTSEAGAYVNAERPTMWIGSRGGIHKATWNNPTVIVNVGAPKLHESQLFWTLSWRGTTAQIMIAEV
jgi:hypothetical protein